MSVLLTNNSNSYSNSNSNNNSNTNINKSETGEKKTIIIFKKQINQRFISNPLTTLNKSKSKLLYSYPICLQTERDPFEDYKLRLIRQKYKGYDSFLENYYKFNFAKNDVSNMKINKDYLLKYLSIKNKNDLLVTEDKNKNKILSPRSTDTSLNNNENLNRQYKRITRSNSFLDNNPYSKKSIKKYKNKYINEIEKRGNSFTKRRIAYFQRLALNSFSSMNINDSNGLNGSILSGNNNESLVLEAKEKEKEKPMDLKDYLSLKLKDMKDSEKNSYETFKEHSQQREKQKKLPKIINIKNSKKFHFHVFHDRYGFVKEMDKRENLPIKMTKEKIRDLKIMAKIKKIKDPFLIDIYKRVIH